MSKFEWISIIISFVALAQPWIIKLWNSFFRKLKITFIPSGKMKLFYNRSGAYIQIGGVVEAKNQSATVKDISAKVTRCCDNAELKLNWCSFSVPSFQNIAGNIVTTTETARPFKVESNGLYPVFVEFCNADDIFLNNLSELHNRLIMKARSIPTSQMSLDDAQRIFRETSEYRTAKESLLESFYWKESKYILELVICYNDDRKKKAYYSFSLSKAEIADFKKDIDTAMNCAIYNLYGQSPVFYVPSKDYVEMENNNA